MLGKCTAHPSDLVFMMATVAQVFIIKMGIGYNCGGFSDDVVNQAKPFINKAVIFVAVIPTVAVHHGMMPDSPCIPEKSILPSPPIAQHRK